MKAILKLIELLIQLFRKHEQSEHEKKVQAARRDPAKYINELGGVRDDTKEDANRSER